MSTSGPELSGPELLSRDDEGGPAMERTDVNPWEWSKAFGFSQAVQVSGGARVLFCSGQTASGPDGAPPTTTDMAEQVALAFANLCSVLEAADMTIADVVRLTVYTTDVDALLADYGAAAEALAPNLPAMTLIGVSRLAFPEIKIEIEATAVR
jgi:enamine deaminase RidA (YjgF/YER057c/UK114 family)